MDDVGTSVRSDSDKVSDYWGQVRAAPRPVSWLDHPVALRLVNRRVSGDELTSTYAYWHQRFLQEPAKCALSLGCGHGGFERGLIGIGAVETFEAHDLSPAALENARQQAADAGLADRIHYAVMDLNDIQLPESRYDAIFAISSVHHVLMLEPYFKACRAALKPGALLFMNEYIGPNRFQCSPFVVRAINRILAMLPEKYRRNLAAPGHTIESYVNASIEVFENSDPSEAIRSAEIMSTLGLYFDVVDYKPYGGAILHMLLSGIAGNFDENDPGDVILLEMMTLLEELLEEAGAIEPDFAAVVARPKF